MLCFYNSHPKYSGNNHSRISFSLCVGSLDGSCLNNNTLTKEEFILFVKSDKEK